MGRESRWYLAGHCTFRTQMYHTLLHYKFRLLLKIREKLKKDNFDVDNLLNDDSFIKGEINRFTKLIDDAGKSFGGADFYKDTWESKDTKQLILSQSSSAKRSSSSSSSSRSNYTPGAPISSWLNRGSSISSSGSKNTKITVIDDNVGTDKDIYRVDI